jgi:hypothetical protein
VKVMIRNCQTGAVITVRRTIVINRAGDAFTATAAFDVVDAPTC